MLRPSFCAAAVSMAALAACSEPPTQAELGLQPVAASTLAIENRRAEIRTGDMLLDPVPVYAMTSPEREQTGRAVSSATAATRAMAAVRMEQGIALKAGGQLLGVAQVNYDTTDLLVAKLQSGTSATDPSDALKGMAASVTGCQPKGPVWSDGASFAVELTCL